VEGGSELLDAAAARTERMVLALRTRTGIKLDTPEADVIEVHERIDSLARSGLVARHGSDVVLTRRGRLLANEVTVQLLGALERGRRPPGPVPTAPAVAGTR
jgi:coproporphyrinogen III oxidase-like Fe-S oxidoreductase